MSRRIGWRLRRKYRPLRMLGIDERLIKPLPKKIENKSIEIKRLAAESYIRYLDRLHR